MTADARQCANCRHFAKWEDPPTGGGTCQRWAPRPSMNSGRHDWPTVDGPETCGEWQAQGALTPADVFSELAGQLGSMQERQDRLEALLSAWIARQGRLDS